MNLGVKLLVELLSIYFFVFVFVPYLLILLSREKPLMSIRSEDVLLIIIPMLIWGFLGFRQVIEWLRIDIAWGEARKIYLFGSCMCAPFGFMIIPVLILRDLVKLFLRR